MFSSIGQMFSRKRKSNPNDTGTGYGGNPNDTTRLKAGRKKAEKASDKEDKAKTKFLIDVIKKIQKMDDDDDKVDDEQRIASTLADVFRNQIPNDWSKRDELYDAAFEVTRLLSCERFVKLLGDKEDAESVLYWLVDFGNQAEQILKHEATIGNGGVAAASARRKKAAAAAAAAAASKEDDCVSFANNVISVRDEAVRMAKRYNSKPEEELTMISFAERYQGELGPLRFDTVDSMSNHYFLKKNPTAPRTLDTRKLFKELAAYRNALPVEYGSSCFCRVINSRLDLLRVMITGPDGSPYANGCFFFDISLPPNYPQVAPKVQFLTTGGGKIRFNPNLYNCGKVCLSLLGTWSGPGWISGESTLLQVLISIQSLILVPDPYFNEPGWEPSRGTPMGDTASKKYNATIRHYTIDVAIKAQLEGILNNKNPYSEFEAIMTKHFLEKRSLIEVGLKSWAMEDKSLWNKVEQVLDLFGQLVARAKEAKRQSSPSKKPKAFASAGNKSTEPIELDDSDVEEIITVPKPIGKSEETIDLTGSQKVKESTKQPAKTSAVDVVDLT